MAAILLPIRLWREVVTHWASLREWLMRRRERRSMLDSLVQNGNHLMCSQQIQKQHNVQFADIGEKLELIGETTERIEKDFQATKKHNQRQDKEIRRSAEHREILSEAMFAMIDDAIKNGKNGPFKSAHARMLEHMRKEALKPYEEEKSDDIE